MIIEPSALAAGRMLWSIQGWAPLCPKAGVRPKASARPNRPMAPERHAMVNKPSLGSIMVARSPPRPRSRQHTPGRRIEKAATLSPPPGLLFGSALPEERVEGLSQPRFFRRIEQRGDHLLLRDPLDDAGRIGRHVAARRQPPEFGVENLAFLTKHEVRRQPRRVRVPGLGIDGDLRIEQRHGIERKYLDRFAGELNVERQAGEIVQGQKVFAGAD